jgi:hypothetical protein
MALFFSGTEDKCIVVFGSISMNQGRYGADVAIYVEISKVAAKRIIVGKWTCSDGQACLSPNHLLVEECFVPKLVAILSSKKQAFCFKPVQ